MCNSSGRLCVARVSTRTCLVGAVIVRSSAADRYEIRRYASSSVLPTYPFSGMKTEGTRSVPRGCLYRSEISRTSFFRVPENRTSTGRESVTRSDRRAHALPRSANVSARDFTVRTAFRSPPGRDENGRRTVRKRDVGSSKCDRRSVTSSPFRLARR